MLLGTAQIDITPESPVPLAGFADRKPLGPFEGISHRLFARLFLFESEEQQGQRSLLVSADLIWWGSERIPELKHRIKEKYGIEVEHIIFHATHTHSGPQTSNRFTSFLGECDPVYVRKLEDSILKGIEEAEGNIEAVTIERCIGNCSISIHRRLPKAGRMELAPNAQGPVDPELNVVSFRRRDGSLKSLLVHYACHPVVTMGNLISSEFCGVAMELVEQALGGDTVSAYLQGCCGDVNPGRSGEFSFGTDHLVCSLGAVLAEKTLEIIQRPGIPGNTNRILAKTMTTLLPLKQDISPHLLEQWKERTDVLGEWSRLWLANPERAGTSVPLEMTYWQFAEKLSFLTMNCEVVVEYGLFIKSHFNGRVLPLGYSNGMFGYLPTSKQVQEGGYEPYESVFYFAMPHTLHEEVEQHVRQAVISFIPMDGRNEMEEIN
jgi:hypothetical protein